MPIAFNYAARSDVGMVRTNNEDSGYAGPHLLAMADGMGGHAGGDVASSTIIGALADLDDQAFSGAEATDALLARIALANAQLGDRVKEDPALRGMGTTLIALLRSLKIDYPDAEIMGHCELEGVHKACPSFSCQEYRDYFESNDMLA